MLNRLFKLIGVASLLVTPASAEMISDLVEKEVFQRYEYQIDEKSRIDIRLIGIQDQKAKGVSSFWLDKASGKFIADVRISLSENIMNKNWKTIF